VLVRKQLYINLTDNTTQVTKEMVNFKELRLLSEYSGISVRTFE
jgi:hypothetical protein